MTQSKCPQCGLDLPAGSPEGLCPRCLMQAGLASSAATSAYVEGAPAPTPVELQPHFPQLEILELIGKGGMGAVYKARQIALDRIVAVKILPPRVSSDPAFAERFAREAKALARLNHPHIVTVHDFGQAGGYFYFLMEHVDGVNLRQAIRAGKLQPPEALKIVPQVCDALQYAHDEGIVHRDIKPENILLDKRGRVKMADFGLAKLLGMGPGEVTLTGTQQTMGTLHYMAPEQVEGTHTVDHRADIYSLGVTFYEMLTGELPLGRFAPPSHKVQVDVRLDEVVLRALEKDPEQRYQHASEVKTEVEAIGSIVTPATSPLEKLVRDHWPQGKIAAIKAYREETGVGLAEAKQAVEEIATRLQLPEAEPPAWAVLLVLSVFLPALLVTAIWLRLSALIWVPLVVSFLAVPQTYRAWKHWGTPRGQRAALLAGGWWFFLLFGPVMKLLFEPATVLDRLYELTGVEPGPHDVLFLRGAFVLLLLFGLLALVQAYAKQRLAWSAAHPDVKLPRYRNWVIIPTLAMIGVYVTVLLSMWLTASAEPGQDAIGGAFMSAWAIFLIFNALWVLVDIALRSRAGRAARRA